MSKVGDILRTKIGMDVVFLKRCKGAQYLEMRSEDTSQELRDSKKDIKMLFGGFDKLHSLECLVKSCIGQRSLERDTDLMAEVFLGIDHRFLQLKLCRHCLMLTLC